MSKVNEDVSFFKSFIMYRDIVGVEGKFGFDFVMLEDVVFM